MGQHYHFEKGFLGNIVRKSVPRGHDKLDFERNLTSTRVPGAQILGEYEVLLVYLTVVRRVA